MTTEPLVSIVIAVYNGQGTIQRCLDSIIRQSSSDWELIVIDGGSTDETVGILTAYKERLAYWISEPDRGIYHAWNKALAQASGEWVIFLGADDFLASDRVLSDMEPYLKTAVPRCRVVYGKQVQVDQEGEFIRLIGKPWSAARRKFTSYMTIPHSGTFHHHGLFVQYGGFREDLKIAADYEFLLRELPAHPALFVEDVTVAAMQLGGVSARPANHLLALREIQIARQIHGMTPRNLFHVFLWLKIHVRICLEKAIGVDRARAMLDAWRQLTGRKPYWTRQ